MSTTHGKALSTAQVMAQIFKPFANRTVEEDLNQIHVLISQAADPDVAESYNTLLPVLQAELEFAKSDNGKTYYEEAVNGHLRITSDIIYMSPKSIVRDPEFQGLFPLLPDIEYDNLKQSIANHGLLNALLLTHEDKLICGYNRLRACEDLGMIKVPVRRRYCVTSDHAKSIAIADNLIRRHFSPSEAIRTMQALEMIGPISLPELAKHLNVSVRSVKRLKSVNESLIPEFKGLIDGQDIPLRKAELIASLPKDVQIQIYDIFKATNKIPSNTEMDLIRVKLNESEKKVKAKEAEMADMQTVIDRNEKKLSDQGKKLQELSTLQSATEIELSNTRQELHRKVTEESNYKDKLARVAKDAAIPAELKTQYEIMERQYETALYAIANLQKTLSSAKSKQIVPAEMVTKWTTKLRETVEMIDKVA